MTEFYNTIRRISTNLCKLFDIVWMGLPKVCIEDRVISRIILYYSRYDNWIGYMNYNFFLSLRCGYDRATINSSTMSIVFMKVYHCHESSFMDLNRLD